MISKKHYPFEKIKTLLKEQKKTLEQITKYAMEVLENKYDQGEKALIESKVRKFKDSLKEKNNQILGEIKSVNILKNLSEESSKDSENDKKSGKKENPKAPIPEHKLSDTEKEMYNFRGDSKLRSEGGQIYTRKELILEGLEGRTIKRLHEGERKIEKIEKKKKIKKTSAYSETASKFFSKISKQLLGQDSFKELEKNLIKANLDYSPPGYISLILFTTLLSFLVGGFLFLFFLFFNIGATAPFVTRATETINVRFLKVFWLLVVVPVATFFMMYIYPSLEKKAAEFKIDAELPFATIHMAAISGSMINPIKIFEILILTKEYKAIDKEFTKLLNEINIYGSDFVNALKNTAKNTSSKKLAELLTGLATNINSGGNLPAFFEKRSETLLFDYRLQREKATKSAETFMDIYISIVIAAPMVLMLLLMMMKISGLGLGASVGTITLAMILGVVVINIIFLAFLHLKRQS